MKYDSIKEQVKRYVQSQIDMHMEYETKGDAGESYAYCVHEGFYPDQCVKISSELMEKKQVNIPVSDLMDKPEVLDFLLEMLPGSVYGAFNDDNYVVFESYPVQEIEVQIEYSSVRNATDSSLLNSDIDEILKEEFCVHVGNGETFEVYESTDAVWFAGIKIDNLLEMFQEDEHQEEE